MSCGSNFLLCYSGDRSMSSSSTLILVCFFVFVLLSTNTLPQCPEWVSPCVCVCVSERERECVWRSQRLTPALSLSSAAASPRTQGHWDNYKTMSRWKLPRPAVCRNPPLCGSALPVHILLLLLFSPPLTNWHRSECDVTQPCPLHRGCLR